jgi:hypothetical protein
VNIVVRVGGDGYYKTLNSWEWGEGGERRWFQWLGGMAEMLPRSLHSVTRASEFGAPETAGHSGRDDRKQQRKTQEKPLESRRWVDLRKPGRWVGASQGAETGGLAGGAKFEGTCPFVQAILGGSEPAARVAPTHPSRSRGAEPECQL